MINLSLSGNGEITLSYEVESLGVVSFHAFHSGIDLLSPSIEQPFSISPAEMNRQIRLNDGGALTFSVSIKESSQNWFELENSLTNSGASALCLESLQFPRLELDAQTFSPREHLWSMQGAAVGWGQDFASELPVPYRRENYLGHLQDAEGGGIPVAYFWKPGLGIALMHTQSIPQEWYLPVEADADQAVATFERRDPLYLQPGETFTCPRVVISVHQGDFFEPLNLYRALMEKRGIHPASPTPASYEPGWCSWGYGFDINSKQMLGVLPALADLGIHWVTLDDRWFDAYGDWRPRVETFPGGADEIRQLNEKLHAAGFYNQIWWYPLCAEDGHGEWDSHAYVESDLIREHPDWVVRFADGTVARNNRHLAMLCPALPQVQDYTRDLTIRFIRDWGFDGHKLDNIYTMPACHNPAHRHSYPEESIEAFARVYQSILDMTLQIKPNAVTQICPCGTPLTHNLLPCTNQPVTADPTSSRQIRQRIKFYKGLMGPKTAVFADHVELSDGGSDFASEIGTGGVPATKFTFPEDEEEKLGLLERYNEYWGLSPEKRTTWKKWLDLYNRERLSESDYLNLYDLAFDVPEAHAIQKGEDLFYAFYAPDFSGEIELRGLGQANYRVVDSVTGTEFGVYSASHDRLSTAFSGFLLLQAIREK